MKRVTGKRKFSVRLCSALGSRASHAFTLIEMMVVLGMLGILMGVAFSGIGQARSQARIAKATSELRELMNAWLSYEAAYDDWPADMNVDGTGLDATESNLKVLLGKGDDKVVYLNAPISGSPAAFRDPWGTEYRFKLLSKSRQNPQSEKFHAAIAFPNRHRYAK